MGYPTRLTRLTDDLYVWAPDATGEPTWGYANCVLVTPGGYDAVLIDTPYDTEGAKGLKAAAESVLLPETEIGTVINTHLNGDHSYTNGCYPGARIIGTHAAQAHIVLEPSPEQMHELVRGLDPTEPLGWYMQRHFGRFDYRGLDLVPPNTTFSGTMTLTLGDDEIRMIEVGPAHTNGDLIVHLPRQRAVATGDVLFHNDHPVHWAGPLSNILDAVETIIGLNPEIIVPGHGPVMYGTAGILEYRDYLRYVRERIHAAHSEGKTAQQAAADLMNDGSYPHLGLRERLVVLTYMEYVHLEPGEENTSIMTMLAEAARFAFARHHEATANVTTGSPTDTQS